MNTPYQISGANMDVYNGTDSLVIRSDGRMVPIPSKTQHTSGIEEHVSTFVFSNPSRVIAEETDLAHNTAIYSSNAGVQGVPVMPPLIGSLPDDHTNSMTSSQTDLFSATGFCYGSSSMDLGEGLEGPSHMGMSLHGAEEELIGDFLQSNDPLLSQSAPFLANEDDNDFNVLIRKLEETPYLPLSSDLVASPYQEPFQSNFDSLSATIGCDYLGDPVQVQPQDNVVLESHSWNQSLELTNQQNVGEGSLVTIRQPFPQNLCLDQCTDTEQEGDSNMGYVFPISASVKSEVVPPSPTHDESSSPCHAAPLSNTTRGTQSRTPMAQSRTPRACVQDSAPSSSSFTPLTPAIPFLPSQNGPFEINNYKGGKSRIFEVGIGKDIADDMKEIAYYINRFSWNLDRQYKDCSSKMLDIKTAIVSRAEICECNFDQRTGKLTFSMPRDCVRIDQWPHGLHGDVDLCDRLLVVQQLANLLTCIHCNGCADKLCLWGSFVVCVAPSNQVYVLVDFLEIASKTMNNWMNMTYDPRIDDVKALHNLYKSVLQPFIHLDSSWVSPLVKKVFKDFETSISDPSVDSMAFLARILGASRLCKLEVEIITLSHCIFCIEHEPLCDVLSHIEKMLPQVSCDWWEVQWMKSNKPVAKTTTASAHHCMQLRVIPVQRPNSSFPLAVQRTLCFKLD